MFVRLARLISKYSDRWHRDRERRDLIADIKAAKDLIAAHEKMHASGMPVHPASEEYFNSQARKHIDNAFKRWLKGMNR